MLASFARSRCRSVGTVAVLAMLTTTERVPAADAPPVLDRAAEAYGVGRVTSLELTGDGSDFLFGQAYDGDSPWPRFNVTRYRLAVDFAASAVREERIRTQGEQPPRGGGNQPIPELRQTWSATPTLAWNGDGAEASVAGRERDERSALEARQRWIILTPLGFVAAAHAHRARVAAVPHSDPRRWSVAFEDQWGRVRGTLDDAGRIERIETWFGTPVLGDTQYEAVFSGYRSVDGVLVPGRIVHREGGYAVLDIVLQTARINPDLAIVPPAHLSPNPSPDVPPPVRVADGVWSIPLGARDRSVAVEFDTYVLVVEAPTSEEISRHAIAAIHRVIPRKPIRFVVNTHIHFDHSGGLRTYAAEGATVVTHHGNVAYFTTVWSNPRTLAPDALSQSGRAPTFEGVVGARTFSDGTRTAVVYHYGGNDHHPGMLMVYVPEARILIEADSFNPPATPGTAPNAMPNLVQFLQEVERRRLEVQTVVPIHGRITTLDEAKRAVLTYGDGAARRHP